METNLSIKLRNLRKATTLTAHQVIKKLSKYNLNFSIQSLYKWEEGEAEPEIKVLQALAKIYVCDIAYLVESNNVNFKNLTTSEIFLLRLVREDFLIKNIVILIMKKFERKTN